MPIPLKRPETDATPDEIAAAVKAEAKKRLDAICHKPGSVVTIKDRMMLPMDHAVGDIGAVLGPTAYDASVQLVVIGPGGAEIVVTMPAEALERRE